MASVILKPGLVFTGKPNTGFFTGRIQVLDIVGDHKYARVLLTKKAGLKFSGHVEGLLPQSETEYKNWVEEWLIEVIEKSFETGHYFEKTDWPGWPPLEQFIAVPSQKQNNIKPNNFPPVPPGNEDQLTQQFNEQFSAVSAQILSQIPARIFLVVGATKDRNMQMVFPPNLKVEHIINQLEILVEELKSKLDPPKPNQPE